MQQHKVKLSSNAVHEVWQLYTTIRNICDTPDTPEVFITALRLMQRYEKNRLIIEDYESSWMLSVVPVDVETTENYIYRLCVVKIEFKAHDICQYCGYDHGLVGRYGLVCEGCGDN